MVHLLVRGNRPVRCRAAGIRGE